MKIKNVFQVAAVSVMLFAAGCTDRVIVSGIIDGAGDRTIYLSHDRMSDWQVVDSLKLKADGKFSFSVNKPVCPEFYRISLDGESVVLAIDANTSGIDISAGKGALADASISGSDASNDIQRLRRSAFGLQRMAASGSSGEADSALAVHKRMAQSIILANTASPAAYYAVYQTINGLYIFHPGDAADLPYWTAVATGFDIHCADCERTGFIKSVVLAAQKEKRSVRLSDPALLDSVEIQGLVELSMPDRSGHDVALSSLKGSVVLLDFSSYDMETAAAHYLFLRELYGGFHDRGFEIYSVSLDSDKLFWLEQSRTMPWISVRDNNAPRTMSVISYNVTALPTFFLIDRNGDIVGRYNHENIRDAIETLLPG
ncbi:MAG: thioredoxin-like domain-containing protein [Candidatus Aphodosoma sp.]